MRDVSSATRSTLRSSRRGTTPKVSTSSYDVVHPGRVDAVDDMLALHAAAEVELRFTPRLGVLMDRILQSGLPFSFVRIRDLKR